MEDDSIGVGDGGELGLYRGNQGSTRIIAVGNGDEEVSNRVGMVEDVDAERGVAFGLGELVETDGNLDGGHAGLDDVLIGFGEGVQKIGGGF